MSIKNIKQKDGIARKISDSYSVLNLLTAEDSDNVSLALGTAKDHNETTKTTSDRVYYVLEGELIINDEIVAKKEETIFISANTEYNFKGSFKALLVNSPPFKKSDETTSKT